MNKDEIINLLIENHFTPHIKLDVVEFKNECVFILINFKFPTPLICINFRGRPDLSRAKRWMKKLFGTKAIHRQALRDGERFNYFELGNNNEDEGETK